MLRTHGRYDHSPITARPAASWPNGRGLAVYVALNLEHYAWGEGLVEDLVPGIPKPDVLNNSWREYGNRVGAWRLLELMRSLSLPVTLLINSELYEACPELIAAFRSEGAEIASHGRTNSEHQAELAEGDERALIDLVSRTIERHEGRPPAGWLSPWIAETERTPDLLHEAGVQYFVEQLGSALDCAIATLDAIGHDIDHSKDAARRFKEMEFTAIANMAAHRDDEKSYPSVSRSIPR